MQRTFTGSESRLLAVLGQLRQNGWVLIEIEKLVAIYTTYGLRNGTLEGAAGPAAKQVVEQDVRSLIAANILQRNGRTVHLTKPVGVREAIERTQVPQFAALLAVAAESFPKR